MSSALTPKQEKFCQAIVRGMNQSAAYREAYDAKNMLPTTINERACRLMQESKISTRVEELREPVVEKARYDLETAMGEANRALVMAEAQENPSVMVAAVALRAKLYGLLVEKSAAPFSALETAATDLLEAMLADFQRSRALRDDRYVHHT